jgi:colanic acid/amylovoran biosynthesis glycosyltransferase
MRIIYVTARLPNGSDEAFIVPEVLQLTRLGHEVLIVPRSPRGSVIHGQEVFGYARREPLYSRNVLAALCKTASVSPSKIVAAVRSLLGSRSLAIALKNLAVVPKAVWLADLALQWRAGHIHCHWAGTTATMTMLASRISGVPWSLTAHRWDIVENNLLAEKIDSANFARFISDDGLKMATSMGIKPDPKIRVLRMGVALSAGIQRLESPRPVVLCPARLVEVKGHRFLIEAWRILKNGGVRGELWFAGQGEYRERLESLTKALGLAGSVRFLGALPHAKLLTLYQQGTISIVALASVDLGNGNHEGIPVALIEAMSYGIPVVTTRTGGNAELVTPDAGFLVPPEDPVALANTLRRLLADRDLRKQFGESGRERAMQAHDIVGIAAELVSAFETSVQPSSRIEYA